MSEPLVAVLPGDGIGPEVMAATLKVLRAMGTPVRFAEGEVGWEWWKQQGTPLPPATLELVARSQAVLFGAVTSKPPPQAEADLAPHLRGKGLRYRSPIVALRQRFDLFANVRPCVSLRGNPLQVRGDIDIVVVRENTQGLYAGLEFEQPPPQLAAALASEPAWAPYVGAPGGPEGEVALSVRVISARRARRIVAHAFALARSRGESKVTLVEKPNVLRATSGLMVRVAQQVAADFPAIALEEVNVDAAVMWLVKRPEEFGVIVTSNLFGDILSDLCAQLVGGLGLSPSGSYGPSLALFEPTHGSVPKYAGKDVANPLAAMLSAAMMLDHLGQGQRAAALRSGIEEVLVGGTVRTADLGGSASMSQMTEAVVTAVLAARKRGVSQGP